MNSIRQLRNKNKKRWVDAQFKLGRRVYARSLKNNTMFITKAWLDDEGYVYALDTNNNTINISFLNLYGVDKVKNTIAAVWDEKKPFLKAEDYADLICKCIGLH